MFLRNINVNTFMSHRDIMIWFAGITVGLTAPLEKQHRTREDPYLGASRVRQSTLLSEPTG